MTALALTSCPACRLRFTGKEPPDLPCRRCGSNLGLVRTAFLHAETLQGAARRALAAGKPADALAAARKAVALVDTAETRRTLIAALVLAGRLRQAAILADADQ